MQQATDDNFDWKRQSLTTSSQYTGPNGDHTVGLRSRGKPTSATDEKAQPYMLYPRSPSTTIDVLTSF